MGYNHPDILKSSPYNDDFEDTKKFLKVLFKPGYAVQARELTQLQTLLQNQIAKFGSHIFKDGSQVFGGGVTLSEAKYIRVSISVPPTETIDSLKGKIIQQGASGTNSSKAKIMQVLLPEGFDNKYVLILQYLTGNEFVAGAPVFFTDFNTGINILYNSTTEASGKCQLISVESGIFYVDGHFVNSDPQSVVLYEAGSNGIRKFYNSDYGVTNRVGFQVERTVVTVSEDQTLVDPARGFYNYNAPGADRYVINLNLIRQSFDPQTIDPGEFVTEDFVEIARVVEGVLDYVKRVPTYSDLVDTLARRTYDESGHYTVKAFELEVKNHLRDDVYSLFIKNEGSLTTFLTGDFINTPDGSTQKLGVIVGVDTYTPTQEELSQTTQGDLPTHIFRVKRRKVNGTLNYTFFTTNDVVRYKNVLGTVSTLGTIKRVTISRDPEGVYSPENNGDENKFVLSLKPGKAYVFGYEFETINNTNIPVDKLRTDGIVVEDDYNLGSNIGNYFIVSANSNSLANQTYYKFNNWSTDINLEETPFMKFGGRYTRITIPVQDEDTRDATCKYWSPLALDQDSTYRSVLFASTSNGLTEESIPGHSTLDLLDSDGDSTSNVDTTGYIRPQDTQRPEAKYIGGLTSIASYPFKNASKEVELNISRFVFTDPWHGNFETSYNILSEDQSSLSTYLATDYPVLQIKCLNTSDPTQIQVTKGNALRWVPASKTGAYSTAGSSLFVEVTESIDYAGTTEGPGDAHFSIDDGVIFADPSTTTNPISYGTSIAYIIREQKARRLIIRNASSLGCVSDAACTPEGQGGFYSVGDIVTQTYTLNGVEILATAEVLAIGGDFNTPNSTIELYLQSSGVNDIYGVNDDLVTTTGGITNLGCLVGPCGLYKPRSSESLDNPTCGELIRIGFRDSVNVGGYQANETVFQYNYLSLRTTIGNLPEYLPSDLIKGKVISWDQSAKELLVLENQNRFEVANGTIYQLGSGSETNEVIKYGGRGWDYNRTKYQKSESDITVAKYEIEKVSGVFLDMDTLGTQPLQFKNYIETSASVFDQNGISNTGETLRQIAVPSIDNYIDGKDFTINEIITQNRGSLGTARGKVLSWTHRDPTVPTDSSPTILIIQPLNSVSFAAGPEQSSNDTIGPIQSFSNPSVSYDVSGSGSKRTKEIIGCGRLRLLRRQEINAYQAYFFDIKMDYLPDRSRKYDLNEVSEFYYEDSFKNADIFNFEDEDIQLAEGTNEENYVFKVDSTFGIDTELSVSTTDTEITYSKVFDTDKNSLIFPLPGTGIVKTVGEMDYRIQKYFELATTNQNFVEFTTNSRFARFIGGESSSTGKVDANDLIEHYILIAETVTNQGKILVDLTKADYEVTTNNQATDSPSTVTITRTNGSAWISSATTLHLIANLNINPNGETGIRKKSPKRASETIKIKKTKSGEWKSIIRQSDVYAIDKVTTISGSVDIKDKFIFFNGQTDNVYDFAQLTLKSEFVENNSTGFPNDEIVVYYRYYNHEKEGPITKNSYIYQDSEIDIDDLPLYTSPSSGKTLRLDSCIDMRPIKVYDSSNNTVYIQKKWIPAPAQSFDVDYEYYQGIGYKLVITRDLKFKLIPGIPAFIPQLPADDENAMTIYDIIAEPYVFDKNNVISTMVNNRRYTMKDIIGLETRIEKLEEFATLSSLERETQTKPIIDPDTGLDRVKSSLFVDNFASHIRADVNNEQYNVGVDSSENLLRPPFKVNAVDFDSNYVLTNLIKTSDNVVLLSYDEISFVSQLLSSGTEIINQFDTATWIGTVTLSPGTDSWFDTDEVPDVRDNEDNVNSESVAIIPTAANNNATGMNMQWNNWFKIWKGEEKIKKGVPYNIGPLGVVNGARNRRLIERSLSPDQSKKGYRGLKFRSELASLKYKKKSNTKVNVGENKVVDKSVIPFIRPKEVTAKVDAMKPFTEVYVFFDDTDITSECTIINSVGQTVSGGALKTDSKGSLNFKFNIGKRKFKAGEKILVVTDSSTNAANATTIAEAIYDANGAIEVSTDKYVSTRKPLKKPSKYSKEVGDPVSQTFFVDEGQYPEGVFVSSIDIFFASKDDTLPITLEIRPTNNGYPLSREKTTVYPFASKTLYPGSVKVSSDPNTSTEDTRTRFTFSTPVHLLPGEHAIVLKSNSSNYSVYVAEIGQTLLNSNSRIAEQPSVGSFFKSQTAGRWDSYENIDLMFGINRCEFTDSTGQIVFKDKNDVVLGDYPFELYSLFSDEIKFNSTSLKYFVKTTDADSSTMNEEIEVVSNVNITPSSASHVLYNGNSLELRMELNSESNLISPLFDIDRLNFIIVRNMIEGNNNLVRSSDDYNGELEPRTPIQTGEIARVRYITKIIELEKGFESTNVDATLAVNTPPDTSIQIFIKQQSAGKDSNFDDELYYQLIPDIEKYISPDSETYRDITFKLPQDLTQPFAKYAIKICLYSKNPIRVPKVKELRVVSVV